MEDKDQVIVNLKANLYDLTEELRNMRSVVSDIAQIVALPEKSNLEDLGNRLQELVEIENEFYLEDE